MVLKNSRKTSLAGKKSFDSQHKLSDTASLSAAPDSEKCFHHDCIKIALNSDVPYYNKEDSLSLITNFIKTTR